MPFFYRGTLEKSRAEKNCTLYPVPLSSRGAHALCAYPTFQ